MMDSDLHTASELASQEAVHKTKNAQQAVEAARAAQMIEIAEETALRTKTALLDGLKEVFGDSDTTDPAQMRILVRRIPILCTNIETMHDDIGEIKDSIKWAVRLVLGAVILAILALVFK